MSIALTALVAVSAALHLRAEYRQNAVQVYLFKPLTMVLILALALWGAATPASAENNLRFYPILIITGLSLSLLGDIFLMLPSDPFMAGLACFLLAHIAYIIAFSLGAQAVTAAWLFIPLALILAFMSRRLWPHLGMMKAPVLLYEIVIIAMLWRAAERWLQYSRASSMLALVGALLFVFSDAALAVRRFAGPFRGDHIVVMGAYVAAQWAIALSVA